MSIYFKFSVGRAGTSGANARYITREPATKGEQRAIFTQNYPEYAREGNGYKKERENIVSYARQQEEDELQRPRKGRGEKQTHYRAVASFEGKVETEKARAMGEEYLKKQFPNARAIGVVHQDTEHTHIHFHIQDCANYMSEFFYLNPLAIWNGGPIDDQRLGKSLGHRTYNIRV